MTDKFRALRLDALMHVRKLAAQDPVQAYFSEHRKSPFQQMDFALFQSVKADLCAFLGCKAVKTLIRDAMIVACNASGQPKISEGTPLPKPQPFSTQSLKLSVFPEKEWHVASELFARNFERAAFYLEGRTRLTFIDGIGCFPMYLPATYRLEKGPDDIDTAIRVKSLVLRARLATMRVAGALKR